MSYEVIFAATTRRDLQRIPPRIVPAIIEFVFGDLAKTPSRVGKRAQGRARRLLRRQPRTVPGVL